MNPVKLYVYDLSRGLARQLSLQMTGKQIDGIWHTSVVVFGQEIYYGRGISITTPGNSHHGKPMQILDMGETALDEETLNQYITEISGYYTAEKYHLLDFNCNTFTNDCINFLTGGTLPVWIKNLPQDFLTSPLGTALRPTIDNMFGQRGGSSYDSTNSPGAEAGSSLAENTTSQVLPSSSNPAYPTPAPTPPRAKQSTRTVPVQILTNPTSMNSLLSSHRCVSVFFTSSTCPPCRIVEPVFEDLARDKAAAGVAFAKVDIAVGGQVASQWNIRATPTFLFFLDGKKVSELKGADVPELRTQVDLLIFQAFPPHPHISLSLPTIRALSLQPILFSQVPTWNVALGKLVSFIDASENTPGNSKSEAKEALSGRIVPYLQTRFPGPGAQLPSRDIALPPAELLNVWSSITVSLSKTLPPHELFPLVDFWRLGLLENTISTWLATPTGRESDVLLEILDITNGVIETTPSPRNLILTTLRLVSNSLLNAMLASHLLDPSRTLFSPRQKITELLIPALLHVDPPVRTAAASLAFNIAAHIQRPLMEAQRSGKRESASEGHGEGDWEVEIVSAIVESLAREEQSEEVVHRLTAALALLLHLSPFWSQLASLTEVLQVSDILRAKLGPQGGVTKKEVRTLIEEVVVMCDSK